MSVENAVKKADQKTADDVNGECAPRKECAGHLLLDYAADNISANATKSASYKNNRYIDPIHQIPYFMAKLRINQQFIVEPALIYLSDMANLAKVA